MNRTTILILILCVGTWNIRGALYTRQYLDKLTEECDVLAITEHWLTEHTKPYLDKSHEQFEVAMKVKCVQVGHRGEGGVAILARKLQSATIRELIIDSDSVTGVKISRPNCTDMVILYCILPSTNHSIKSYEECMMEVFDVVDELADTSWTVW
jgi:hypothetical protein